jgi:lysylphosphatidylglycerol synthetase-like protein (DUF2156 family)
MTDKKTSWRLKILAWVSIILTVWMLLRLVDILTILEYRYQIPIGAVIVDGMAVLSFLAAGIFALKSIRVSRYLYTATSIIWLLRVVLYMTIAEPPPTLSAGITVFMKRGGPWLLLGILGIIVCIHEMKKLSKINHEPEGN